MLPADTVLCCPRTQSYVTRGHSVMLPADTVLYSPRTVLCCPRTQRYVAHRYSVIFPADSVMLPADTALYGQRTQRYVARGHSVMWTADTFEMRKSLLTLCLVNPRYNVEAISPVSSQTIRKCYKYCTDMRVHELIQA